MRVYPLVSLTVICVSVWDEKCFKISRFALLIVVKVLIGLDFYLKDIFQGYI